MTLQSLDSKLLLFINQNTTNNAFDVLMPFLSHQGYLLVLPFLIFLFIIGSVRKNHHDKTYLAAAIWTFVIACCSVIVAEWTEYLLKNTIQRVRPCEAIEGIRLITSCPGSFSMPSGHAISSFAFATPLYFLTRDFIHPAWRLFPLLLASFIAFSRIYLGVHYPSDVIVGVLLGAFIGWLFSFLYYTGGIKEKKGIRKNG